MENKNIFSFVSGSKEENIFNLKKNFGFSGDIESQISPEAKKRQEKAQILLNSIKNGTLDETLKNSTITSGLTTAQIFDAKIAELSNITIKQKQKVRVLKSVNFNSLDAKGNVNYNLVDEDVESIFSKQSAPEYSFLPKGNIKRYSKNIRRELDYADGIQQNNSYNPVIKPNNEGQFSLEEFTVYNKAQKIGHDLLNEKFVQARNNILMTGAGLSQLSEIFDTTIGTKIKDVSQQYQSDFIEFLFFGGNGATGLVNDTTVTDLSADANFLDYAGLQTAFNDTNISTAGINYVKNLALNADSNNFNGQARFEKPHIIFPWKFRPLFQKTGLRFSDLSKRLESNTMIDALYEAFGMLSGYSPDDIKISFTNVFDSTDKVNSVKTGLDVVYMYDRAEPNNMFYHEVVPFQLFSPFGGVNSPANTSNGYIYNYLMAGQFSSLINLVSEKRYIIKK